MTKARYTPEQQEQIAAMVVELFDVTSRPKNLRVAVSALTSVQLTLVSVTADLVGIEAAHVMIDSIVANLTALREATTPEEMQKFFARRADGFVGEDGEISETDDREAEH